MYTHSRFSTVMRAFVLAAIGLGVTLVAHATNGGTSSVYVESHAGGTSRVETSVHTESSAAVDVTATINGATVLDIHQRADHEPIDLHEVRTTPDGGVARADVTINTPAPEPLPLLIPQEADPVPAHTADAGGVQEKQPAQIITSITSITSLTNLTSPEQTAHYVAEEEPHDDPLVRRIMQSVAHTIAYVLTIFF